jgi:predicted metal-binding membrane protein
LLRLLLGAVCRAGRCGIMSVAWMLLLTLVVFVEKLLPRGRRFEGALGIALMTLAIVEVFGAIQMPWKSG